MAWLVFQKETKVVFLDCFWPNQKDFSLDLMDYTFCSITKYRDFQIFISVVQTLKMLNEYDATQLFLLFCNLNIIHYCSTFLCCFAAILFSLGLFINCWLWILCVRWTSYLFRPTNFTRYLINYDIVTISKHYA